MLLEEKKVNIAATGMKDTVDFRAKLDGMMFDNLINGIYSNKIGAGIREYATNARDGHARRGNLDTPFEVGLPTRDKAFFEVRDYGSSLTHEEVFDIFAVLGESTKRDTNDETGCLGLGSKSAFAYTNQFTVTCWKDEVKRDYSCYIGEAGQPKVSLISEVKSREPEGVRVSYAVKQDDIDSFNEEAKRQLRGFDPQPKITRSNSKYKPLKKEDLIIEGNFWKLYKSEVDNSSSYYYQKSRGKPMAVQGAVAYPIESGNATLATAIRKLGGKHVDAIRKLLESTDVIIRFEIGELRMTTSREELAYDDRTCENLAKKLKLVVENIQEVLDKEYESCKSLREARILRSKSDDSKLSDLERVLGTRERYWGGELIVTSMVFGEEDGMVGPIKSDLWVNSYYSRKNDFTWSTKGELRLISEYNYRNKFGEIKAQFQFPEQHNKNAELKHSVKCHLVSDVKFLIDIESLYTGKNKNSLMRQYWKNTLKGGNRERFVWLKVSNESEAKEFLNHIYHDKPENVTWLHKLTELKMPKKGSTNSVANAANPMERKIRTLIGKTWAYSGELATYEMVQFDKITEKLPVCFFKNNEFYRTKSDMENEVNGKNYQDMSSFINSWCGSKVYVINGQQMKFYKENPSKFCELMPYLKKEWKAANPDWERKYAESQYKEDDSDNVDLARKFWTLKRKYNITFKTVEPYLNRDEKKIKEGGRKYTLRYTELPDHYSLFLMDDLKAALLKHPQPTQVTEYATFVNADPVLKFLISEVCEFNNTEELLNAIKHYKRQNQE